MHREPLNVSLSSRSLTQPAPPGTGNPAGTEIKRRCDRGREIVRDQGKERQRDSKRRRDTDQSRSDRSLGPRAGDSLAPPSLPRPSPTRGRLTGGEQAGRVRGHDSQAGWLKLGGRGGGGPRLGLLPCHPPPRPREGPQWRGAFPDFPGGGAVAEVESRSLSCRGDGGDFGDLEVRGMGAAPGFGQVARRVSPCFCSSVPPSQASLSLSQPAPSLCLSIPVALSSWQRLCRNPKVGVGPLSPGKVLCPELGPHPSGSLTQDVRSSCRQRGLTFSCFSPFYLSLDLSAPCNGGILRGKT